MTHPGSSTIDILLISRCPPYPLQRGDRLIPFHLARQLSRRGYQIDLLAFYQEPEDLADVPYYERYFKSVTLVKEAVRTPLNLLARSYLEGRHFPARKSRSWSPQMWEAISDRLQHHRMYDVVHLFGGVHVYEFRELLRHYPTIIAPYESYSLLLEREVAQAQGLPENLASRARLSFARNYERWMFQGFQRTVVVSQRDADTLLKLNPSLPVAVIPNGVDLEHFVPTGEEPDTPSLLFTGNLAYRPNLDAAQRLVREIFPLVRQAVPDAELLLVGANPPQDLRDHKGPGVQVTGAVPDLRPYFESARVYVSPLRLGAGIKNKILEALAMQKAIVATSLSCDGIDVTHGQNVILAEQAQDIARATIRLLQDAPLRTRLAVAGRELIEEHYTWRRVAESYEALYRTVIRERNVRNY